MKCRFCSHKVTHELIDLQNSPASNSFLSYHQLNEPEVYYPLKVYVCENCFLVQIDEYKKSDAIFNDEYVYFSSFSKSWLDHSKKYVNEMYERFALHKDSQVIEIASNDGYLLQYFKELEIPVLGIEPTANTAKVAEEKGINTIVEFMGVSLAKDLVSKNIKADLLLGNNVLAHVPNINDFVEGMKILLKPNGVITMEFPHLKQMIDNNQFDTIYHEHYSYLSLSTVKKIFENVNLEIFDVQELQTHGGSLRIFAKHSNDNSKEISANVKNLLYMEESAGLNSTIYYSDFQKRAKKIKLEFLRFLIDQKNMGKKITAYGAAAKGNTLINYCGIKNDLIDYVIDLNPHKQNKYLPGSHIPVATEDKLRNEKPDFVIILPWNLKDEIMKQLSYIKDWNGKFIVAIPELKIYE